MPGITNSIVPNRHPIIITRLISKLFHHISFLKPSERESPRTNSSFLAAFSKNVQYPTVSAGSANIPISVIIAKNIRHV